MENIKEDAEKAVSGISKLLSDVSDIIIDRFRNPYIVAFAISWVAFNWKPVVFFLLSNGNVEYKINHIKIFYSEFHYYFLYPLISAIIYLFFIPYLNQVNEWFLRLSIRKRADYVKQQIIEKIKRDRDIAIEEDEKQEAIKNARESTKHNEYVDSLKAANDDLNNTLSNERLKNLEEIKKAQLQYSNLLEEIKENSIIQDQQKDEKNVIIHKKDLVINEQKDQYQKLITTNKNLEEIIKERQEDIERIQFKLDRARKVGSKVIEFYIKGNAILEFHNKNNNITYYDLTSNKLISLEQFYILCKTLRYTEVESERRIELAIEQMRRNIPVETLQKIMEKND